MIEIKKDVVLAPFTTFRIGGPAKYFTEVGNEDEMKEALSYAKENSLEFFVMGGGSNLLISDNGFDGLVIRMTNVSGSVSGEKITCGAGLMLSEAVRLAASNGLTGMEWAAGIPGTVGGAVYGNAGAYGGSMSDIIENVKILEIEKDGTFSAEIKNCGNSDCSFEYRNSAFKKNGKGIIFSVVLALKKGNKEEIETQVKDIIEKRKTIHPSGFSAGSVFQNPVVEDQELIERFERDTGAKVKDNKVPAGWLVMEAGLKGKKIGGVEVSEKHSNFIVNSGSGKAEDVIILTSMIKQKVREKFHIQLKEEIRYVGF
ncbi:MAG: UDP-N-acetylmuramate dehydrogenase [Candidatus Moranbacteria bacterium]|nr:UDP-N-acetylmuramate dehydrogenase [Candidatus Moranbacteria bacterium]